MLKLPCKYQDPVKQIYDILVFGYCLRKRAKYKRVMDTWDNHLSKPIVFNVLETLRKVAVCVHKINSVILQWKSLGNFFAKDVMIDLTGENNKTEINEGDISERIKTSHSENPTKKRADLLPVSKIIHVASAIYESLPPISITCGYKTNHTLCKMF